MSAKLVGRALQEKGLNATEKLILIGLADCTNTSTGKCMPSLAWLGEQVAEKSERTVRRWLRSLEDRRLIFTVPRAGTSNTYIVYPETGATYVTSTGETAHLPPRTEMSALPRTPLSPTPDTQMSGPPDTQMSGEPEGTRNNRAVDEESPHHYCRALERRQWVEHPESECDDCNPETIQQELVTT